MMIHTSQLITTNTDQPTPNGNACRAPSNIALPISRIRRKLIETLHVRMMNSNTNYEIIRTLLFESIIQFDLRAKKKDLCATF